MSKTILLGITITAITIAAIIAFTPVEQAEASGPPVFKAKFVGVSPTGSGVPAIHGMPADGVAWVVGSGNVVIDASGQMKVTVKGLVMSSTGTTGGITPVAVSLFCGPAPAGGSSSVPLSASGNLKVIVPLGPATCNAPSVLIMTPASTWIASTGF